MLVKQLLCEPSGSQPWKNFWRYTLNCAYPDLNMGLRLITSSCTFQLLHRHETASVLQRHAFDAWAEVDIQFTPPPLQPPVPGQNGAKRRPPPGNDQGRTSIHNQVKMKPPRWDFGHIPRRVLPPSRQTLARMWFRYRIRR